MDFQTLKYLAHLLNIEFDLREWKIVINSILASFKGHNIFSIFKNHHDTLIEFILEQLDDMRSENEIKRVQAVDTYFDRKMYRITRMATPRFIKADKKEEEEDVDSDPTMQQDN